MKPAYDPPRITDPENVDALTHQQIVDAFDSVANATHELINTWLQARQDWTTSTETLLRDVRNAVDGNWTGTSADAAMVVMSNYCGDSLGLGDQFKELTIAVNNSATTAVMTKAFLPKVEAVSADPATDPNSYDTQTRAATTAQSEARRIMQERYITGFQNEDTRIPSFPQPQSLTGTDPGTEVSAPGTGNPVGTTHSELASNSGSGQPSSGEPGETPAATEPAAENPSDSENPSSAGDSGTSGDSADDGDSTSAASAGTPDSATSAGVTTPSTGASPSAGETSRPGAGTAAPVAGGSTPDRPGGTGAAPRAGASIPPAPGGAQPAAAAGTAGTRAATPGAPGMAGAPMGAARGAGRDGEQEKRSSVPLTHGDNTLELLGEFKHVPPVIGDQDR